MRMRPDDPQPARAVRVFPRRTRATPDDPKVYIGEPDMLVPPCDEIHISVAFSWDLPEAERLGSLWRHVAPTKIGGPATDMRGEEFVPGQYLKPGYVITSRGCPNRCWFCSVWQREGAVRELPITDGWNVLDDNLLACSEPHIRAVFAMLARQPRKAEFTGGLEAARLKDQYVDLLANLRPSQIFFAYDTPDDLEPLIRAGKMLTNAGLGTGHRLRAYVLIGYPADTFARAEARLRQTIIAGFMPMAMLRRDKSGKRQGEWVKFQHQWARPYLVASKMICE